MASRLNSLLGINDQFKEGSKSMINQGFGGEDAVNMTDIHELPLKWICPRFSNKYINDPKTTRALAKSIEKNGLLQPIVVVEIKRYLQNDVSPEEREYLQKMSETFGCRYFISSGHRRYKAALSNALNKDVETEEDIIKFYESLKKKNLYEKANNPLLSSEEEKQIKKLYIPSKIIDDIDGSDNTIYNDTNLTSRATTTFEMLANTLDVIGKEDPSISEIKTYIYDNYGLEISESTLYKNLSLLNTFKKDERYLEAIYNGRLTNKDAKVLKTIFNKIDKDKVIKEINNKNFDVNALKKSLTKKTKGRPKTRTYSKAEVLDLLNKIKIKELSVDEAMKTIREE